MSNNTSNIEVEVRVRGALGIKRWYIKGTRIAHREDGPAVERPDGTKEWWLNGKRHRDIGPALEHDDGSIEWWLNDKLHRKGGPAIELASGTKEWWLNGKLHREDGPAIVEADGTKHWYINGNELSDEQVAEHVSKLKAEAEAKKLKAEKLSAMDEDDVFMIMALGAS